VKELEDYPWFPPLLRNFQTEFIGFLVARFNAYGAFINYLNSLSIPEKQMVDLCSGSGEPAISIFQKTNSFNRLILTDKYPNPSSYPGKNITYLPGNMDVLEMKFEPGTCYTMFNSFHHFDTRNKLKIIYRMQNRKARGFFVEILQPTVGCFLKILLLTTLGTILFTPFVRPFSFKRLFFTYIIPVNVLTITYDGIVSVFKSCTVSTYRKLFAGYGDSVKVFKLGKGFRSLVVIQVQPE
jgi:hypothetical protein